jgi:ureidoglycolate lyase
MPRVIDLPLALCTPESFAPFGQVLQLPGGESQHKWSTTKTWSADFAIDGKMELMFARVSPAPMNFNKMERHFSVTQTFIPLGDTPAITIFAAPTGDANDVPPDPARLRALLVPGNMAIMMYRGVWHSGRYLVKQEPGEFVILTDEHTTAELQAADLKGRGRLTHIVEYDKSQDISFRLTDPLRLLPRA